MRAEDIAYDKNDPTVVYMADTGGRGVGPAVDENGDPTTGRLARSDTESISPNGAIFRFDFNDDDPTKVDSFTKTAQGDDDTMGGYVPFKSPDTSTRARRA